ncbi:MAG: polyprenyl synthetase family protein [bacterium]|nr:polyprenyl synthetase family protein [bacterium]
MAIGQERLLAEVKSRGDRVRKYIADEGFLDRAITSPHLRQASGDYLRSGGKSLRPAVAMFCCGALGGEEEWALPASAAVEITHNWTLIHDDIIDRDELRRGKPTAHFAMSAAGETGLSLSENDACHYGTSLAILGGDIGQCWAVHLLGLLRDNPELPQSLAGTLIEALVAECVPAILEGETLDVQQSTMPLDEVSIHEIEDMLAKKTGALYEYCAFAGGMIGARSENETTPEVAALMAYARLAGTAFQFIDDTLGYVTDDAAMGKPALSDIREGKRTTVVVSAYRNADPGAKERIERDLGRADASADELTELKVLLMDLGGVEFARDTARERFDEAFGHLAAIPKSEYKQLLEAWGLFLLNRNY